MEKLIHKSQIFLKRPYWLIPFLKNYFYIHLPLLEIGTGKGATTKIILTLWDKKEYLGIELDKKLYLYLLLKSKIRLINKDFLNIEKSILNNRQIFGSLPYRGSKKMIMKIANSNFKSALLIIQKEVFYNLNDPNSFLGKKLKDRVKIFKIKELSPQMWEKVPKVKGILFYLIPKDNEEF